MTRLSKHCFDFTEKIDAQIALAEKYNIMHDISIKHEQSHPLGTIGR